MLIPTGQKVSGQPYADNLWKPTCTVPKWFFTVNTIQEGIVKVVAMEAFPEYSSHAFTNHLFED